MGWLIGVTVAGIWLATLGWSWQHHRRHPNNQVYRDLLAGGALALATLGFFWRTVSGDVYQPADGGDLVSFLFPTYRFAADVLAQGQLPLWNPHLYGGAPHISDIQAGFLYPPNLLLFLIWPDFPYTSLQWLTLGHLLWAGLGLYVLLRTLTWPNRPLSRPAALFGALAFQFSDPFLMHLGNLNLIAVLSWLPWVLATYAKGLESGRLRWLALAGGLFALGNYAGHAQSTLYIGLTLGVYTVVWMILQRQTPFAPWLIWNGGALLTTGLLAAMLSAPILLPTLELAAYTERSNFTYQDTVLFSLAPSQLLGMITPGFFGRGPALHWSLWERVETPYTGVATLLLAPAGLLLAGALLRRRLWLWAAIAIFGLGTALGVYLIVHGWLTLIIPGLGQMRAPARALVLWALGISVLAAVGVDHLIQQGRLALSTPAGQSWYKLLARGSVVWLALILPLFYLPLLLTQDNETAFLRASVALLALAVAALFWVTTWAIIGGLRHGWWSASTAAWLLITALLLDLSAAGAYTDISSTNPTQGFNHPDIVSYLQNDPDLFRIDTDTDIQDLWQPDTAALAGLQDIGGIANPLRLHHQERFLSATGGRHTRRYDLLNVKYVIVRDDTPLPEGKFELALDAPGELAVYENRDFRPRSWLVHDVRLATDVDEALAQLQNADFNPYSTLTLLEEDLDQATPFGPLDAGAPPGAARVIDFGPNHLTINTQAAGPGILALSEIWYPGWRATVNEAPMPVLRINGALRGVPVPAGESLVHLRFAPRAWRLGYLVLAGGLVALAALLWLDRRPRLDRRTPADNPPNV